jgi:hypothetical protein
VGWGCIVLFVDVNYKQQSSMSKFSNKLSVCGLPYGCACLAYCKYSVQLYIYIYIYIYIKACLDCSRNLSNHKSRDSLPID